MDEATPETLRQDLQNGFDFLDEMVKAHQSLLIKAQQNFFSLSQGFQSLNEKLVKESQQKETMMELVSELNAQNALLEARVNENNKGGEVEERDRYIEWLKNELEIAQKQANEYSRKLEEKTNSLHALNFQNLAQDLTILRETKRGLTEKVENLMKVNSELLEERGRLKASLEESNEENEKKQGEMKDQAGQTPLISVEDLEEENESLKEEIEKVTEENKQLKEALDRFKNSDNSESFLSNEGREGASNLLDNTLSEILESGDSILQTSFSEDRFTLQNKVNLLEQQIDEFRKHLAQKNAQHTQMKTRIDELEAESKELEEQLKNSVTLEKYKKCKKLYKTFFQKSEQLEEELKRYRGLFDDHKDLVNNSMES